MPCRRPIFDFACLPALLVGLAGSWASAAEPFPFPAPPARARSSVYLAPEPLPALPLPATHPEASPPTKRLTQLAGTKSPESKEPTANSATPRGGLVPPARKSIVPDSAESDRRIERLQRQLDQLNELLSRPPVEPPVIDHLITPIAPDRVDPPAEPARSPRTPEPPAAGLHEAPDQTEPVIETKPAPKAESSRFSANGLIKGLPVAAIDRVHVADNLFAAGEFVLANEVYEQVDRRSISSDESGWVEFQLANCSRRLGRLDDAKKRYRRVVADPTLGWLQDMAKWRLDAIDEREQLIREHTRLEAAIKQSSEAPRAATKP